MSLHSFGVRNSALLAVGFILVLSYSSFHLFDSPETWMDEGLIIQSAQGLLETGKAALPVAPGVFEPAWYITTGFPVTLPLAGAFRAFGVSLETARLVMMFFLLGLYGAFFVYAHRAIGGIAAWFGLFLLIFFGPLYGNGRNVLGEIPGLLFIMCALLPLMYREEFNQRRAVWVGMWTGLAVVTKPIFILFLPAFVFALLLRRKEFELKKFFIYWVLGGTAPLGVWILTQFDHVSLSSVLSVYANPHNVEIWNAIIANIRRFFTEIQPAYFVTTLAVWTLTYGIRRYRRETVSLTEEILLIFSVLICLAYLRTTGYYRYFFPAQVFTVLYLPQSLLYLVKNRSKLFFKIAVVCLFGLVLFQAYETTFRSWTAVHYDSTRTESLKRYFAELPAGEEIFIYQAPEVVPFAWRHSIYQYVKITPSIRAGEKYTPLALSGSVLRVITPTDFFQAHSSDIFPRYMRSEEIDSYVILVLKVNEAL